VNPGGLTCAQVEALAPELALGTIDGAERAAVLSHLMGCGRCRELADQLAGVADGLLLLAPPAEPPPGFESRVLSRLGSPAATERTARPGPRRRTARAPAPERPARRPRRALVGIAAVALIAALAGGGLALLDGRDRRGADVYTAFSKDDEGQWTCRAVASADPSWLLIALERADGSNRTFAVEARRAGKAARISLGNLTLRDGRGSLAIPLSVPASELRSIWMVDDTGQVRYEMEFRPTS
jgi:hypothetical protein